MYSVMCSVMGRLMGRSWGYVGIPQPLIEARCQSTAIGSLSFDVLSVLPIFFRSGTFWVHTFFHIYMNWWSTPPCDVKIMGKVRRA
jgi:hypothetical protein